MLPNFKKIIYSVLILFFINNPLSAASDAMISLSVNDVELTELIKLLARTLHKNIIISSKVSDKVSLVLENVSATHALDMVLDMYGLGKQEQGSLWFIDIRPELIKHQDEIAKWQALQLSAAPMMIKTWQIKYSNAKKLAHLFQAGKNTFLTPRGSISIDGRTNTICIQDSMQRIKLIDSLIKRLDVPVPQILIKARIVSIDRDITKELGLDFVIGGSLKAGPGQARTENTLGYRLAIAKLAGKSFLDIRLAALESAGYAELISSPSLFTENQQMASIEAGEEVPYQEVSESGGTATVFKKAVLALKVTPQVLPGNKVLMQLQINQDRPGVRQVLGVPAITTRQLTTQILVKTGETVILGGIYESNHEKAQQGFPILSKIPIVKYFFTQHAVRTGKRELLIFVTPTIIDTHENRSK